MTEVKPEKFILDATAGFRMMWFNKHHPNCIYLDQRPECEPDIVGDFRDLKQFPDETFKLIVFDPPHLLYDEGKQPSGLALKFGGLRADTWEQELEQGFKELWRVLRIHGILIFKWTNYSVSSDKVLKLIPTKPLFYQVSASREKSCRKNIGDGAYVKTLWFCFMKIPEPTALEPQEMEKPKT